MRHNFWAVGRHWVWWSTSNSGGYLVYSTSTDGIDWTTPTQVVGPGINADAYSAVWFNGTDVMYVGDLPYNGNVYVFRMGVPKSDGSIGWIAPQETISNNAPFFTDVKTDSNGYVWISYTTYNPMHTYAMRNQKRDGTWLNGTQYQLDQTFFWNYLPTDIVPLANGTMYFTYNDNRCVTGGMYGRFWNGSTMSPQDLITNQCPTPYGYSSAVGIGNSVYLALAESDGSVHFQRRFANGTWTADYLIQSSGNETIVTMSINSTSNLILFWQGGEPVANTVFYRVYSISSNSWSPTAAWFVDPEGFTPEAGMYSRPGSFYSDFGNSTVRYIGFQYSTLNTLPYNVKYAFLTILPKRTVLFTQAFPIVNVTANATH